MGIKVKGTDGTIELGGNFNSALSFVKGVEGRKYDPQTKVWSVPVPIKHFDMKGFSIDVLSSTSDSRRMASGHHQTAYGNVYSSDEWAASKEINQIQTPDFTGEVKEKYERILEGIGCTPQAINAILHYDFLEKVEYGKIKFHSKAREEKIMEIYRQYEEEWYKALKKEQEEEEVQKENIFRKYGLW